MAAVKRSLNVGVIGLGHMGLPIARNLAFKSQGSLYLQLHSRSLAKARRVCADLSADGAGGTATMRLHDRYDTMARWCDVLLLTLPGPQAVRRVLLGEAADEDEDEEGEKAGKGGGGGGKGLPLLQHCRPGQLLVNHTTVDVGLARDCAAAAAARGAVLLDAPLSGSPRTAFHGQLVLMAGGDREAFQRLLPLFRLYADSIHHLGGSGCGAAAKLLSQALVASHNAAAAEAMTMANRLGIEDQATLVQVLDASWGASTMLRRNAPTMQDLLRSPDRLPPTSGATIDHLLTDLASLDVSLLPPPPPQRGTSAAVIEEEKFPVLDASLRMLGTAAEAGMGDRDLAAVVHFVQAAANMERAEAAAAAAAKEEKEERQTAAAAAAALAADFVPKGLTAQAFTSAAAGKEGGEEKNPKQGEEKGNDKPFVEFSQDDFY